MILSENLPDELAAILGVITRVSQEPRRLAGPLSHLHLNSGGLSPSLHMVGRNLAASGRG